MKTFAFLKTFAIYGFNRQPKYILTIGAWFFLLERRVADRDEWKIMLQWNVPK